MGSDWGPLLGPLAFGVNGLSDLGACGEPSLRGPARWGPYADPGSWAGLLRWGQGDQLSRTLPVEALLRWTLAVLEIIVNRSLIPKEL